MFLHLNFIRTHIHKTITLKNPIATEEKAVEKNATEWTYKPKAPSLLWYKEDIDFESKKGEATVMTLSFRKLELHL